MGGNRKRNALGAQSSSSEPDLSNVEEWVQSFLKWTKIASLASGQWFSQFYCYRATSFTRMTKTGIKSFVLHLTKDGELLCTNLATQGLTQSPMYFEIPTRPMTLNLLATLSHNTTVWSSNRINPPRLCVPSFPFRVTPPRLPTESPELYHLPTLPLFLVLENICGWYTWYHD